MPIQTVATFPQQSVTGQTGGTSTYQLPSMPLPGDAVLLHFASRGSTAAIQVTDNKGNGVYRLLSALTRTGTQQTPGIAALAIKAGVQVGDTGVPFVLTISAAPNTRIEFVAQILRNVDTENPVRDFLGLTSGATTGTVSLMLAGNKVQIGDRLGAVLNNEGSAANVGLAPTSGWDVLALQNDGATKQAMLAMQKTATVAGNQGAVVSMAAGPAVGMLLFALAEAGTGTPLAVANTMVRPITAQRAMEAAGAAVAQTVRAETMAQWLSSRIGTTYHVTAENSVGKVLDLGYGAGSIPVVSSGLNVPLGYAAILVLLNADLSVGDWTLSVRSLTTNVVVSGALGLPAAGKPFRASYSLAPGQGMRTALTRFEFDSSVGGVVGDGANLYTVQTAIADNVMPNVPAGWFPAHPVVSAVGSAADPLLWGSDVSRGRTSAEVVCYIRASDGGPDETGFSYTPAQKALGQYPSVLSADLVALFPWANVADAYQRRNIAPNTRAQIRRMRLYVLLNDGTWLIVSRTTDDTGDLAWAERTGDFYNHFLGAGGVSIPFSAVSTDAASLRYESSANGRGLSLGKMGYGEEAISSPVSNNPAAPLRRYGTFLWNLWPLNTYRRSRSEWESQVRGTMVTIEGRLILNDPSGADDRASSGLMLNLGADYYNETKSFTMIAEAYHNRWRGMTNSWEVYVATDIPQSVIAANPPPGFDGSTSDGSGPTTPTEPSGGVTIAQLIAQQTAHEVWPFVANPGRLYTQRPFKITEETVGVLNFSLKGSALMPSWFAPVNNRATLLNTDFGCLVPWWLTCNRRTSQSTNTNANSNPNAAVRVSGMQLLIWRGGNNWDPPINGTTSWAGSYANDFTTFQSGAEYRRDGFDVIAKASPSGLQVIHGGGSTVASVSNPDTVKGVVFRVLMQAVDYLTGQPITAMVTGYCGVDAVPVGGSANTSFQPQNYAPGLGSAAFLEIGPVARYCSFTTMTAEQLLAFPPPGY